MKRRAWILCFVFVFCLSACGSSAPAAQDPATPSPAAVQEQAAAAQELIAAPSPSISEEAQKQILENNRSLWEFTDPWDSPWFYTFTDLDHNGRLEVLAASVQGSGIYTYAHFYEVRTDGSGIENVYHENEEIEGPDDWPEIIMDSLPCAYDAAADRWYYACEGVTKSGYAYQYSSWNVLCLKDGIAEWEPLASMTVEYTDAGDTPTVECRDAQGNSISEQDYNSAVDRRFTGMERSTLGLTWTQVDIPWEDTAAEEEAASEPADRQELPAAVSGPQVIITKNPTSESLAIGGKTWFIAHADNAVSLTWQLTDPEGNVYSLDAARAYHSGLTLEVLEGDTIAVSNVPLSLNGWGIQARFDGEGNSAVTEPAYIYVGDFVTAYGSVISKYRAAYESGNSQSMEYAWNNGISEMTAYSSGVGYVLKDLDKNGIPELIIAGIGTDDFSDKMAYDLYTLVNGVPVNLATSMARMRYYVRTDNTVYWEGSGGAAYSYCTVQRLNGTELEDVEMVFTNMDGEGTDNPSIGYYWQQGHSESLPSEKSVKITQEDFYARMEQLEAKIFVPPLTKIYG